MTRSKGHVTGDKTRFVGLRITQKQYENLLELSKQTDYPGNVSEMIRTIVDEYAIPPDHRYRFQRAQINRARRLAEKLTEALRPLEPDLRGDLISDEVTP